MQLNIPPVIENIEEIKAYLGIPIRNELEYDIALIDVDNYSSIENYNIINAEKNYFVTSFDTYSLKKGLEVLSGLNQIIKLTKVMFSRDASREEEEYLNYLSLGYKIEWDEEKIYFPFEVGDQSVIAENQRVAKIKFKRLSDQYKEGIIYIAEELLGQEEYSKIKKVFRQLERGV